MFQVFKCRGYSPVSKFIKDLAPRPGTLRDLFANHRRHHPEKPYEQAPDISHKSEIKDITRGVTGLTPRTCSFSSRFNVIHPVFGTIFGQLQSDMPLPISDESIAEKKEMLKERYTFRGTLSETAFSLLEPYEKYIVWDNVRDRIILNMPGLTVTLAGTNIVEAAVVFLAAIRAHYGMGLRSLSVRICGIPRSYFETKQGDPKRITLAVPQAQVVAVILDNISQGRKEAIN
ncbi:MAG: hypothetical protein KKH83_06965 [Candidatus Margulisbacteria bacterium]|nr:hypothetical protein [Candidatus Margulisiibacteriota bacterium]